MDNSILTYCSISIAVLSLFFTLFGNFWCFYVTSTLTASVGATGEALGSADVYFGIWSRQHYMYSVQSTTDGTYIYAIPGCVGWGFGGYPIPYDTKWNSAKAFTILATIIGGIAMILCCGTIGDGSGKKLWPFITGSFFVACFFQCLTFLFLRSNVCSIPPTSIDSQLSLSASGCALGAGAAMGIVAACLWGVNGMLAAYITKSPPSEESLPEAPTSASADVKA